MAPNVPRSPNVFLNLTPGAGRLTLAGSRATNDNAGRNPNRRPMKTVFEAKPRWPGAPPICLAENLPSFQDEKAIATFYERYAPRCHILIKWQCESCSQWHAWAKPPSPAGETSGTTREYVSPPRILALIALKEKASPP